MAIAAVQQVVRTYLRRGGALSSGSSAVYPRKEKGGVISEINRPVLYNGVAHALVRAASRLVSTPSMRNANLSAGNHASRRVSTRHGTSAYAMPLYRDILCRVGARGLMTLGGRLILAATALAFAPIS